MSPLGPLNSAFPPQSFLRPFPKLEGAEHSPSLVALALYGLEPGLKFVLPELGDHLAFGDFLSFLDRQFDQQTVHLKCKLDTFGGFDLSRKGAYKRLIPGIHDHRFDGTRALGTSLVLPGARGYATHYC